MPQPRGYTASMSAVSTLANRAIDSPEGLQIPFTVARYGSLEACAQLSRSFQTTFSSLRAQNRRRKHRASQDANKGHEDARDLFTVGDYDRLACQRTPLPHNGGWIVSLVHVDEMLNAFDVIDIATGLPLKDVGRQRDEKNTLIDKASFHLNEMTPAECARLAELDPGFWDQFGGIPSSAPPPPPPMDLADLDPDADPFGEAN